MNARRIIDKVYEEDFGPSKYNDPAFLKQQTDDILKELDAEDAQAEDSKKIKVGDIMYASWGYDQTNIDWFKVIKRTGNTVVLQPLKGVDEYDPHTMTGTTTPGEPSGQPPIRRMVKPGYQGAEGCKFQPSYGWISKWDGKPKRFSNYA